MNCPLGPISLATAKRSSYHPTYL